MALTLIRLPQELLNARNLFSKYAAKNDITKAHLAIKPVLAQNDANIRMKWIYETTRLFLMKASLPTHHLSYSRVKIATFNYVYPTLTNIYTDPEIVSRFARVAKIFHHQYVPNPPEKLSCQARHLPDPSSSASSESHLQEISLNKPPLFRPEYAVNP